LSVLFALALALQSTEPARETPRVIVVSFDAAGYVTTSRLLAEGKLPSFERMVREGSWSDGMVTSFPTKTAAAHALLFTGQHGHTSGITANSVLRFPPSAGTRLDTLNGFFSDSLRAEPVWAKAAARGLETYVFHAPQVYPFRPQPHLNVVYGYNEATSRGEALAPDVVLRGSPDPSWMVPESKSAEAREIGFAVGDSRYRGLLFDDPADPVEGCDSLGIAIEADLGRFVARLKPGEGGSFSSPIAASLGGRPTWFSLRLFTLASDGSSFVLYRSGTSELVTSPDDLLGGEIPGLRAYAGNGGGRAYSAGGFGPTLPTGGSGEAERRFLDTELHLASQLLDQARWGLSQDYRLVLLYSPVIDDVAHELYGYLAPDLESYDEALAQEIWPILTEAFAVQDRFLGMLLDIADNDSAHVIVVSDHGMSGIDKLVHLNVALQKAGLLALGADGSIDLSRTRALAPPLGDASVAVNAVDRPGGIVPLEEKPLVLEELRSALSRLKDPVSGERIVTAFFEPALSGLLQPGGESTGDLFLDFAPGYYPSTSSSISGVVVERTDPSGEHVFVPTRRDMLAIFAAYGPRIPKGVNLGRIQAIDVAPTILDLLGIEPPADLPGKSLVPGKGILNP
jgi:predicted AlkP superfamily phosphohydrolase/phosphomutase